jgi:hypothetical protein
MKNTFTESEISMLRNARLFSKIGKEIESPRAYKNGHISAKHVSNVLRGLSDCDSDTTNEIKRRATHYLSILDRQSQS